MCVLREFGWQIYSLQCQQSMLTINYQENIIIISAPHMEFSIFTNSLSQIQSPLDCTLSQIIAKPHADHFIMHVRAVLCLIEVCVLLKKLACGFIWGLLRCSVCLLTDCQTLFRMVKLLIIYLAETLVTQTLIYPIQPDERFIAQTLLFRNSGNLIEPSVMF